MSDFISRTALLGYLSKKCAEKDYTTSDMISDIQRFGIDGEATPLPKMKKGFEIVTNLKNFGGWDFKNYPMSKEEADYVVNALEELKRYQDTGLTVEQLGWIDEEYQELAKKVPRWRKCSEELPENGEHVLLVEEVRFTTGKISKRTCIAIYDYENKDWSEVMGCGEFEIVSYPIAWQPLPEWEGEL